MSGALSGRTSLIRLSLLLITGVMLILGGFALFQPWLDRQGRGISIANALVNRGDARWFLNATADIELPPEIRRGLDSGVPLEFVVGFSISKPGTILWRSTLTAAEWRYTLIYYELTRHYRLVEVDTGTSRNFRSLLAALDNLGSLRSISVAAPVTDSKALLAHLRIKLDRGALPLPLQSFWSSNWRLASEEYVWPVY
jgi:hypothetical protein